MWQYGSSGHGAAARLNHQHRVFSEKRRDGQRFHQLRVHDLPRAAAPPGLKGCCGRSPRPAGGRSEGQGPLGCCGRGALRGRRSEGRPPPRTAASSSRGQMARLDQSSPAGEECRAPRPAAPAGRNSAMAPTRGCCGARARACTTRPLPAKPRPSRLSRIVCVHLPRRVAGRQLHGRGSDARDLGRSLTLARSPQKSRRPCLGRAPRDPLRQTLSGAVGEAQGHSQGKHSDAGRLGTHRRRGPGPPPSFERRPTDRASRREPAGREPAHKHEQCKGALPTGPHHLAALSPRARETSLAEGRRRACGAFGLGTRLKEQSSTSRSGTGGMRGGRLGAAAPPVM